jgi:hypothetical protein
VAAWLGSLAALLIAWRGARPDGGSAAAARRFARLATIGLGVVVATGIVRAIGSVGTLEGLTGTDYGRLVVAKAALLAALAALGAINHFRNVPAAGRSLSGLRRVGAGELTIGIVAALLAASLVNLAPPVAGAGPGSGRSDSDTSVVVSGADFGTSVRVRLAVTPGTAGPNDFALEVTDHDTGDPVVADSVSLRFGLPARPDVGGSRLDLTPDGPGRYRGSGANLSLDGTWRVTVVVSRAASSVEVALEIAPRIPVGRVDVNTVPGLPAIYTVHLAAGRAIQVYADPGVAGRNEIHATFFDADGTELPVMTTTLSVTESGGVSRQLVPRLLEPGHVVADLDLAPGDHQLTVTGIAPDGALLDARLSITISG